MYADNALVCYAHAYRQTLSLPLRTPTPLQTKSLVNALEKVGAAADKKVLLVLNSWDEATVRAGRNVEKLAINTADRLQVFDVLNADVIVMEKAAIAKVKELYAPSASA